MSNYKLCPRCELNWIKNDEDLCPVCRAQTTSQEDFFQEEEEVICPICKTNTVEPGEKFCPECLEKIADGKIKPPKGLLDEDSMVEMSIDDDVEIINPEDVDEDDSDEDDNYDDQNDTMDGEFADDFDDEDDSMEDEMFSEELAEIKAEEKEEDEKLDQEDVVTPEEDDLDKEFKNASKGIDMNDFNESDEEDEVEARRKKLKDKDDDD